MAGGIGTAAIQLAQGIEGVKRVDANKLLVKR
jgi:hypothetical protein